MAAEKWFRPHAVSRGAWSNVGMTEITSPRWLYFKGALFLLTAVFAGALMVWEHPGLQTLILLGIAIWSSCRAYYFAFYVIQHYLDPGFRFSGLGAFAEYCWRQSRVKGPQ